MTRPLRDPSLLSWPWGSAPSGSGGPSSAVGLTTLPIVNSHAESAAMLASLVEAAQTRMRGETSPRKALRWSESTTGIYGADQWRTLVKLWEQNTQSKPSRTGSTARHESESPRGP